MQNPNFIFNQCLIYACLEIIIQDCIWQNILKSNWIQIIFTRNDLSISQNCRLKQIIAFFQLFSMLLQRHTFFRFFICFCSFQIVILICNGNIIHYSTSFRHCSVQNTLHSTEGKRNVVEMCNKYKIGAARLW